MTALTLNVEKNPDSDDLLLVFPPEWLEQQGWRAGDTIQWAVNGSGQATMTNIDSKARQAPPVADESLPLFIVETVLSHRIRYAIRARSAEHAKDTVTCREQEGLNEFDQNYLDELIFSTRQVSLDEFLASFDVPSDTHLKLRLIHEIAYADKVRPGSSSTPDAQKN